MVQIHLFSMCLEKTFWLPLIKKKMGPLAFPWDKFRQVASWESLHFFPYSWEQISMPIWCFSRGLMEKGRMCAQPQALINWAHILLSFLFFLTENWNHCWWTRGYPENLRFVLERCSSSVPNWSFPHTAQSSAAASSPCPPTPHF